MLNPDLKGKFEVTDKVKWAKFRHATLGLVDLGKIHEKMAEKLVKHGYLVRVTAKKKNEDS